MVNIVDNKYYYSGKVQIMLPVSNSTTFVGPDGIKFHSNFGTVILDDYINDPLKNKFPYNDVPMHKDDLGVFANQLFQLEKQYLAVYYDGDEYKFRTDYFFLNGDKVYDDLNVVDSFEEEKVENLQKEMIREKFLNFIYNNKFVAIIDMEGELHEYRSIQFKFEMPLSGLLLVGDESTVNAYVYEVTIAGNVATIKSKKLLTPINSNNLESDNYSFFKEPNIPSV